jgi:hypothetical protein
LIEADLNTLIGAISALILAIIGYMNVKRTESASITAQASMQTAQSNATLVSIAPQQYTGVDTRQRDDANGNLTTNQTNSSQWWMNAGYNGPEPSLSTKAMFSDASVAYANAQKIAQDFVEKYGRDKVDPAILYIATH